MEHKTATKLSAELKDNPSSGLLLPVHVSVGTTNTEESFQDDEPSELALQADFSALDLSGSDGLREYSQRDRPASNARSGDEERAVSRSPSPQSRSTVQPISHDASESPQGTPSPQDRMGDDCKTYAFVSLPGNAIKKRPRRRYDEIERLYHCSWEGCTKSYGTLNHLNAHIAMQGHGKKKTPAEFEEPRNNGANPKRTV
ncbi:hypothetical protein V8E53_001428 [Lactarius tabidus]